MKDQIIKGVCLALISALILSTGCKKEEDENLSTNNTTATCSDGIQNQGETGIDCGGPCNACVPTATCSDGIQNQGEIGVDCGGPCYGCESTVTDIDGNVYKTITIGTQTWMAENLKVTKYRNGDTIPNVQDTLDWNHLSSGAYCDFDNDVANGTIYGHLYNGYAMKDSRKIAPTGWHVPSDGEWIELEMFLGMSQSTANASGTRGTDEGGKLKEEGTTHWKSPNTGATNSSGFTWLPGGSRYDGVSSEYNGTFTGLGKRGKCWTTSAGGWTRYVHNYDSKIGRCGYYINAGVSIRCVKD